MTAGIVVLGSLNMDLVARVPVLPRPGETVMGDRLQTFCGGKGANQAVAAARLGGRVTMIGRVGRDGHGDTLVRRLERERVDAGGVRRDAGAPTGAALITVAADGENAIGRYTAAGSPLLADPRGGNSNRSGMMPTTV